MGAPARHDFPIAVELASAATPAPAVLALESRLSCCASRLQPALNRLNRLLAQPQADSSATVTYSELSQYRHSCRHATHGEANSDKPELSAIVLSVVGETAAE